MVLSASELIEELQQFDPDGIVGLEIEMSDGSNAFARCYSVYRETDSARESYLTVSTKLPPGVTMIGTPANTEGE